MKKAHNISSITKFDAPTKQIEPNETEWMACHLSHYQHTHHNHKQHSMPVRHGNQPTYMKCWTILPSPRELIEYYLFFRSITTFRQVYKKNPFKTIVVQYRPWLRLQNVNWTLSQSNHNKIEKLSTSWKLFNYIVSHSLLLDFYSIPFLDRWTKQQHELMRIIHIKYI